MRVSRIGLLDDAVGSNGVRAYFTELFTAFPDFTLRVGTTVASDDEVAVHSSRTRAAG